MTKDFSVQNNTKFSSSQILKKEDLRSNSKPLLSIFDKYDTDKNGQLSNDEAKNASKEIYSYSDVTTPTDFYQNSISKAKIKELKDKGTDIKALYQFEHKLETTPYIDGEIGSSFQGFAGDCWLLSGLNALNTTQKGKEYIKQAIKTNDDGSYNVELKGLNKSYNVTPKDFKYNLSYISRGDNDVKLVEIAVEKYILELIQKEKSGGKLTEEEKRTVVGIPPVGMKDLSKYVGSTAKDPFAGGGEDEQAFFFLTGLSSKKYTSENYQTEKGKKSGMYIQKEEMNQYLDNIMNNKSQYAATTGFKTANANVGLGHTYSIKRVEKDSIILTDPYNSVTEISMPRKEYLENVESVAFCDLGQ